MTRLRHGLVVIVVLLLASVLAAPAFAQDNRINSNDYSAPVAIYCSNGVTVWDINSQGVGSYALGANLNQLADALARAISSGQQQEVGRGLGNVLYVLPSYELRVVAEPLSGYGGYYLYQFGINTCGQVNVPSYPPYQPQPPYNPYPPYQPPYQPPYYPPYQPPYQPPVYHPPYHPPYQQPPYQQPPSYGRTYVVQYGDTLAIIARRYGVNLYALAQANGIYNINLIYAGQRLRIP